MSMLTLSHCLICYKDSKTSSSSADPGNSAADEDYDNCTNINSDSRKNAEICKRFCIIASRYLHLNPKYFLPEKTIKSKFAVNMSQACDKCVTALESFCELYNLWKHLQLEMNEELDKIATLMRAADHENTNNADGTSQVGSPRGELSRKLSQVGRTIDDIDKFRQSLVQKAFVNKKSLPNLTVTPLPLPRYDYNSNSDSDESLFTPVRRKIKVRRKSSSGVTSDASSSISEFKIDPDLENEKQEQSDSSSSSSDELFIPVRVLRKRKRDKSHSPASSIKRRKSGEQGEESARALEGDGDKSPTSTSAATGRKCDKVVAWEDSGNDIEDTISTTSGVSESSGSVYAPAMKRTTQLPIEDGLNCSGNQSDDDSDSAIAEVTLHSRQMEYDDDDDKSVLVHTNDGGDQSCEVSINRSSLGDDN